LQHPKPKLGVNENPFTKLICHPERLRRTHVCLQRNKHDENFQPTSDQQKAQLRLKVRFEVMCSYAACDHFSPENSKGGALERRLLLASEEDLTWSVS
jgi:hypothetical protein